MFRVVRAFSQYCFLFDVVFVSHAFASSPEDHILPFMSDLRFAPDTLFLVAEEDWRLWRADCHRGASTRPEDMPEGREGELSAPLFRRSVLSASRGCSTARADAVYAAVEARKNGD